MHLTTLPGSPATSDLTLPPHLSASSHCICGPSIRRCLGTDRWPWQTWLTRARLSDLHGALTLALALSHNFRQVLITCGTSCLLLGGRRASSSSTALGPGASMRVGRTPALGLAGSNMNKHRNRSTNIATCLQGSL